MIIEKDLDYDGTIVSIKYFGFKKSEDTNITKDKNLVDRIFDNHPFFDVLSITKMLRIILKDYDEISLNIKILYENDLTLVEYYKGELGSYKNRLALNHSDDKSIVLESKYSSNNDINFSVKNCSIDKKDGKLKNSIYNFITEEMNYISSLKNVEKIEFCEEDKKLIKSINN